MKKQLIIIGIAVLLICVGLSGCNEQQSSTPTDNSQDEDPITINNFKSDVWSETYPATINFFCYAHSTAGDIVSYEWSLGEEVMYRGNRVCVEGYGYSCYHTYYKPGKYNIILTVKDDQGNSKQVSREINLFDYPLEKFLEENTNLPNMYGLTYHEIWETYEIISIQGGFC